MKNALLFFVVAVLIPGCALKRPTFIPMTYPVIGVFDDHNEVFKGTIMDKSPYGDTVINIQGQVTGMRCIGDSYPTHVPAYSVDCAGLEGRGNFTCDDGRVIAGIWKATACRKGIAKGVDQNGNKMTFVYGMTETEAVNYIDRLASIASTQPPVPPVYRPKETRKEKGLSTGTGFFVTQDGYIITNFHIIQDSTEIAAITSDSRFFYARVINIDPANDIALLKIDAATKPLAIEDIGGLSKGDEVMTLGYPLIAIQGQEQKATFGRVNSLTGVQNDIRFIQIDVPIQPGNSGGPLINSRGQVVGVVTATLDQLVTLKQSGALPQNVNYAVKSDYVIPLIRARLGYKIRKESHADQKQDMTKVVKMCEPSVVLVIAK